MSIRCRHACMYAAKRPCHVMGGLNQHHRPAHADKHACLCQAAKAAPTMLKKPSEALYSWSTSCSTARAPRPCPPHSCKTLASTQQAHPGMTSASYALTFTESNDWFSANLCPGFSEYVCAPCRSPKRTPPEICCVAPFARVSACTGVLWLKHSCLCALLWSTLQDWHASWGVALT